MLISAFNFLHFGIWGGGVVPLDPSLEDIGYQLAYLFGLDVTIYNYGSVIYGICLGGHLGGGG